VKGVVATFKNQRDLRFLRDCMKKFSREGVFLNEMKEMTPKLIPSTDRK